MSSTTTTRASNDRKCYWAHMNAVKRAVTCFPANTLESASYVKGQPSVSWPTSASETFPVGKRITSKSAISPQQFF